ncbi:MAG TPA: HAD family hydrolase [Phycisphaerae bacterium]|nr:HAD family hydrolase [Phycisphaerae bacterium]
MAIEVVAFDVHQTLAHWPAGRVQPIEVQRLLSRFGIEISYWAFDAVRQTILLLDGPKREIQGWTDFLALLFARLQVPVSVDLLAALTAMHESRDGMELYPDVMPCLTAVKAAGLRSCTFTTLPAFMMGDVRHQVLPLIDHYLNCSAVGAAKGDRRFYQRITEKLGVPPDHILCVGDDPLSDVELTVEAGWKAVLLDRRGKHGDVHANQLGTIDSLSELRCYYP